MNLRDFFAELQRRNVYKVAVAYAVVAWLLIQAASILLPTFDAPPWVMKIFVVAIALGFPIALVLAWAYELTPEGVKRAEEVAPNESITHRTGRQIVGVTVVLAVLASGLMVFKSLRPKPSPPDKSIAVLPFENLSEDKANAYFADGVQDEILTDLARVADLKVISRTSVIAYRDTAGRNLRKVGQELGVAHVLEGSVQRAGQRIRVNAQLVDARTDQHLWAQTYDRDLADVFAIQSEIAKTIADQLQAKLAPNEKAAIERAPTKDITAFDLFSRARTLMITSSFGVTGRQDLLQAVDLLNQAVRLDSEFFQAYCQLVAAHDQLYFLGMDHSASRLSLAEEAIQAVFRLQPEAGEAHLARAENFYRGHLDYDGALAELSIARRTLPNDPRIFELTGYILRRRGQHEEGVRNLEKAIELDPRNYFVMQQIALSYNFLHRYPETIAILDRALTIVPKNVDIRVARAAQDFYLKGDTRPLHETIDAFLAEAPDAIGSSADAWLICALAERDPTATERALDALGENQLADSAIFLSRMFGEGLLARMLKDDARAHDAFTKARAQQEKVVERQPGFGPALCVLGVIDAGLGNKEIALEEGRHAVELLPVEKDSLNGGAIRAYFAVIAAWTGEKDLALEHLEFAAFHSNVVPATYGGLKLLPFWDPLRGDPRFEKFVASLAPKEGDR